MQSPMFGIETEYALTGTSTHGPAPDRELLVQKMIEKARLRFASLPDFGAGLFLENGSRFYGDCGHHPELATPECTNPWDIVRYVLAGERMLHEFAGALEVDDVSLWLRIFKCNVDYSGAQTTWGCHESYLHRTDPHWLSEQIIPHLVTRIIYTGAGGFESLSAGLRFSVSPRVQHLDEVRSAHSTGSRGIFHTKDESLSLTGYHRLHLICGESLCSETSMWLKVATTALVVAMAGGGIHLSSAATELSDPRQAMQWIAADPDGKTAILLNSHGMTNALAIQRHYLRCAEAHLEADFMPSWAEVVCRQWRMILDRLERGPEAVSATLDWAIKYALYRDYAERQGFTWKSVERWTRVHTRLRNKLHAANHSETSVPLRFLLGNRSPVRDEVQALGPYLSERGMHWDQFEEFLRLRQQLFEIDTRFGQLGPEGVFAVLDKQGVLAHHVEGVDRIGQATTEPPVTGRARVRGEFIKKVRGTAHSYFCDWSGVVDADRSRQLNLSDPFAAAETWEDPTADQTEWLDRFPRRLMDLLEQQRGCTLTT